jgi:hypothetical protein
MKQLKKQLKDIGFKKVPTEKGVHMYVLDPATLKTPSKMTVTILPKNKNE